MKKIKHVTREGEYFRVAAPEWENPLDFEPTQRSAGFPALYLYGSPTCARTTITQRFAGGAINLEDFKLEAAPILVTVKIPEAEYVDAISESKATTLNDLGAVLGEAGELGFVLENEQGQEKIVYLQPQKSPLFARRTQDFEDWLYS